MDESKSLLSSSHGDYNKPDKTFNVTDPRHICQRLLVLFLMCFLSFGSYFCYDNPAALHEEIVDDMDITETQYMQLYSWYSWPNVILCFFGGFLLDRVFGIRTGTILFSMFVLFGQLIFALGATIDKLWLMNLGRFIFGIGGESLAVAQNTFAVLWFKEKELNLVFGLQISMARVGSTVNMNIMGPVYQMVAEHISSTKVLGISLFIASITCIFSLFCGLLLCYLDKRAETIIGCRQQESDEVVKLTDVKDFSFQLWLIFFICVGYYVAVFPFIGLGKLFFEEKFDFSPYQASAVNSVVYILSAPCAPVLGFIVDRMGYNIFWVLLAVLMTLGSHVLLAFTFANPWIAMCNMGVSYSLLACALWPMVAFLVPKHQLATAYGFMQSIQNLGLGVVSIAAGAILDSNVGFISSLILYLLDSVRGNILNASTKTRDLRKMDDERQSQIFEENIASSSQTRIKPLNAFALRNRYYSRIGAQIPEHLLSHTSIYTNQNLNSVTM